MKMAIYGVQMIMFMLIVMNSLCTIAPVKKDDKNKIDLTKGNLAITRKQDETKGDLKIEGKDEPEKKGDKGITTGKTDELDQILKSNSDFLAPDDKADEVFRVLVSSSHYIVSQMKYASVILRVKDMGGDEYIIDEIKRLDKINETREGLLSIWLFPDSGSIMKVRPQRPTYIVEVDKLLTDDVQRWNFNFPKKIVQPTKFDIKYRIVLRKTQSDDQILKEIQKKLREGQ